MLGLLWNLTGTAEHKDDVIRAGGLAAAVQVMQVLQVLTGSHGLEGGEGRLHYTGG